MKRKNINPKFEKAVRELIRNEVAKINAEDWIKKIEKTIKEENEYTSLGQLICNRDANEQFIMLAPFTGQPVQHRGYSKPKTKVNANAWVWNIENGNRGRSANSDA
jgi:hypothetical protein